MEPPVGMVYNVQSDAVMDPVHVASTSGEDLRCPVLASSSPRVMSAQEHNTVTNASILIFL